MKRLSGFLLILFICIFTLPSLVLADRNLSTTKSFSENTLIKRGDVKIYRVTLVAKANASGFTIYDSLTAEAGSTTNVKTEGSEATSGNSSPPYDFTEKPLECSTGAYLVIFGTADVVVEYE